jgi:pimeloyl-ACP methyl ester carboxylesterase
VTAELVEVAGLPQSGWGLPLAHGVYHRPVGVAEPRTAFIAVHYNLDFSRHYLAPLLAERGYGFLGWNNRFCGREPYFLLDRALVDLAVGVRWLRERGAETVVLLGNSGGGSLMAAYEAQSRSGEAVVRAAGGMHLDPGLDGLPPGDLYLSVAAHPGRPDVLTNWLDPSVTDELDPASTDPSLDMYASANGPPYDTEFVARYRVAQRARNQRISDWCLAELARLEQVGVRDRLFTVARTWADPRFADPSLDPSERPTPACYRGDPARANRSPEGIGMVNTLRTWLAMWSLEHSQCRSSEYLGRIGTPALVVQAAGDAGVFPTDAQAIFDGLAATDKRLVTLPGDHYFRGASGEREGLADVLAAWVAERAG